MTTARFPSLSFQSSRCLWFPALQDPQHAIRMVFVDFFVEMRVLCVTNKVFELLCLTFIRNLVFETNGKRYKGKQSECVNESKQNKPIVVPAPVVVVLILEYFSSWQ